MLRCRRNHRLLLVLSGVLSLPSILPAKEASVRTFGKPLSIKKALSLQEAIQQPAKYPNQKVLLKEWQDQRCVPDEGLLADAVVAFGSKAIRSLCPKTAGARRCGPRGS